MATTITGSSRTGDPAALHLAVNKDAVTAFRRSGGAVEFVRKKLGGRLRVLGGCRKS
jgi:hypothetical protein